jgi:N-acetylneuraminic acid mutarotase
MHRLLLAITVILLASASAQTPSPDNDCGSPTILTSPAEAAQSLDYLPWQYRANHPEGVARVAGVFDAGGKFHAVCGNCNTHVSHPYDEIWSPGDNTWRRGLAHPAGSRGVHNHDVARIGNTIYAGGGSQGTGYYNNLTALDLNANTWTVRTAMPLNSFLYYTLAAAGGAVYCFGGYNQVAVLNTNYRYDPGSNTWRPRTPMPGSRRSVATAVVGDTIHVFGGMEQNNQFSTRDNHWKYNWVTNTWTTGAPLPTTLGWARAVAIVQPDSGPMIYVLGGVSSGAIVSTVYRYSLTLDTWTDETPLLTATRSHAADALDDRIFVCGGYNAGVLARTQEAVFGGPDAQAVRIDTPVGNVPLGAVIAPRAVVRNNSRTVQTFDVRFTVSDGYAATQNVTLPPATEQPVTFSDWTAGTPGTWETRCTTMLSGDIAPANDLVTGSVSVQANDIQVTSIDAPIGMVPQGATLAPRAKVRNNGTAPQTFDVRFQISGGYNDVQNVTVPAGMTQPVTFADWTAGPPGWQVTKCSVLVADQNPGNDVLSDSVFVMYQDVGTDVVLQPTGIVDSSTSVVPRATVHNYGNAPASFTVRFTVGTRYSDVRNVDNLEPGSTQTVDFTAWMAEERGSLRVRCTTELAGDMTPVNDARDDSVFVRVTDAAALAINAPVGDVDSGAVIAPQATVINNSTAAASFDVRFSIGTFYVNTKPVTDLAPGQSRIVDFDPWTADELGTLTVQCSTQLAGDMAPANDAITGSVRVRIVGGEDVGTVAINAPVGAMDSGLAITPQAVVHNYGRSTVTFDVAVFIGSQYSSVKTVTDLAPGMDQNVDFDVWTATERGTLAVSCTTRLDGDVDNSNDRREGSVTVNVHDVGVVAIDVPSGNVPPGIITPFARLRNYGNVREPAAVTFAIPEAAYFSTRDLPDGLPIGADTTIAFDDWNAATPGNFTAVCSTFSAPDQVPNNNVKSQPFAVGLGDVGVSAILYPVGAIDSGVDIAPQARLHNYGSLSASFRAYFFIDGSLDATIYGDTLQIDALGSGLDTTVTFLTWPRPHTPGAYTARCSTWMASDTLATNDVLAVGFTITVTLSETGWVQKPDVPAGGKNKNVKDGGCLTCKADADTDMVYALKGNGRCEFYKFNTIANTWLTCESIPAVGTAGKKKAVKKGGTLSNSGGRIFASKGNGTLEWWCYDPSDTSPGYVWRERTSVPAGQKTCKEGCAAAVLTIADTAYIYFLKGSGTLEFYRYNTLGNSWETMTSAPNGSSGKGYKDGSCMTIGEDGRTLYVLKGSYAEFYSYSVDSGWRTLTPLTLTGSSGKKKKPKSGAGLAYHDGIVYCVKGGGTYEFWKYVADSDKWVQGPDVPTGAGKPVKGGGATVYSPQGTALYVMKGNNTLDFFKYGLSAYGLQLAASGNKNIFSKSSLVTRHLTLAISPNPFTSATSIRYTLPRAGNASLKLYDVTGQLVTTFASGYHSAGNYSCSVPNLARGIYVLKLATGGTTATCKLIVE